MSESSACCQTFEGGTFLKPVNGPCNNYFQVALNLSGIHLLLHLARSAFSASMCHWDILCFDLPIKLVFDHAGRQSNQINV